MKAFCIRLNELLSPAKELLNEFFEFDLFRDFNLIELRDTPRALVTTTAGLSFRSIVVTGKIEFPCLTGSGPQIDLFFFLLGKSGFLKFGI